MLHVGDGNGGIHDPEIHHGINSDGYTVLGQNLYRMRNEKKMGGGLFYIAKTTCEMKFGFIC